MHQRYPSYTEMLAKRALTTPDRVHFLGGLSLTARPQPDGKFAVAIEAEEDHAFQELFAIASTLEAKRKLDRMSGKNPDVDKVVFTDTSELEPKELEETLAKGLDLRVADAIVSQQIMLELSEIVGHENTYIAA